MSGFGLNTTLGRQVSAYDTAVQAYRSKVDRYNEQLKHPTGAPRIKIGPAPEDPFKGQTQQAITEAMDQSGIADYVRSAPGMISAALGRKPEDE
jgi:hypothetical protein